MSEPRPLPHRIQGGVPVLGPYRPAVVRAVLAVVCSLTDEPVLRLAPPSAYLALYREGRLDAFPEDLVEVCTGTVLGPLFGCGHDILLGTYGYGWAVIHRFAWEA